MDLLKLRVTITYPILFILLICSMAFTGWVQAPGPVGGNIRVIVKIDSVILAGTYGNGGIFRSLDSGKTWKRTNTSSEFSCIVDMVVRYPLVFAATPNGVIMSADRGTTWQIRSNGVMYTSIENICCLDTCLYVLANAGKVFYSNNNGLSWSNITSGLGGWDSYEIRPLPLGKNLYVGRRYGGLAFRSNSDTVWHTVTRFDSMHVRPLGIFNGKVYAMARKSWDPFKMYASADSCMTWTEVSYNSKEYPLWIFTYAGKLYSPSDPRGLCIDLMDSAKSKHYLPLEGVTINSILADGNNMYIATYDGVYYSADTLRTLQLRNNGIIAVGVRTIYPFDSKVLVGSDAGTFICDDRCEIWNRSDSGMQNSVNRFLKVDTLMFAATVGGVFTSTVNRWFWTPTDSSLPRRSISSIIEQNGVIYVGSGDGVYKTLNRGKTWAKTGMSFGSIRSLGSCGNTLYCGVGQGYDSLCVSTDSGASWKKHMSGLGTAGLWVNAFLTKNTTVFVSTSSGIFKAQNTDTAWTNASNGIYNGDTRNISSVDSAIYVGSRHNRLYSSVNNGVSWTTFNSDLIDRYTDYVVAAPGYVYCAPSYCGVWRYELPMTSTETNTVFSRALDFVSPNPFNPRTTVNVTVRGKLTPIRVVVYDVSGKQIAVLADETLNSGQYRFVWDAAGFSSGLYFVRVISGPAVRVLPLVLAK